MTARKQAGLLGLGALGFGIPMFLAPRFSARVFGISSAADPTGSIMTRAAGARDTIIGAALLSAATSDGNYRPWLMARFIADACDALAVLAAMASGARDIRLPALALLAGGASAYGFWLWSRAER